MAFLFQHSTSGAPARILQAVKVWLPAHPPPLGVAGRKKRKRRREIETEIDTEKWRRGGGDERGGERGRGRGEWRAGMCSISSSASSEALCPSSWVSCFAFIADLFTGLSVQRESRFSAAFISLPCESSPGWI